MFFADSNGALCCTCQPSSTTRMCSKPDPYPSQNWNSGIFTQKTVFFPLESSTYEIPIVHRNIGIHVKFRWNWNLIPAFQSDSSRIGTELEPLEFCLAVQSSLERYLTEPVRAGAERRGSCVALRVHVAYTHSHTRDDTELASSWRPGKSGHKKNPGAARLRGWWVRRYAL